MVGWQLVLIGFIGFSSVLGLVVLFLAAITGQDLDWFESRRTSDPLYYEQLRRVMRVNGPMCVGICALALLAFLVMASRGDWIGFASIPVSAALFWLSLRWSRWAWRKQ